MQDEQNLFKKLHPDQGFIEILKTDECRLVHCWLDFGQPTKRCRHHMLANSHNLMFYFNSVFPVELSQAYIDAALLTHGKYNCKIWNVRLKLLHVGIEGNSPLFDVSVLKKINYSIGAEIKDMTTAYKKGEIMSYVTSVRAEDEKRKVEWRIEMDKFGQHLEKLIALYTSDESPLSVSPDLWKNYWGY